jgi:plastocyanin
MRLIQLALGVLVSLVLAATPPAGPGLSGAAWAGARPQRNAVVWVDAPGAPVPQAPRKVVLDQRDLSFSPQVLAVHVGTVVEFPNNDRVFHNVFSFRDGKRFDLGMYPVGAVKQVTFDRPGLSRIFCNIHPNMAAYVLAIDSWYLAVTDDAGAFRIPGLPVGEYVYHAWRPGGPILTGSVSFNGETPLEIRWP